MTLGAETPLVSNVYAGAQPGKGGAVFVSASPSRDSAPSAPNTDTVQLSSEAYSRIQSANDANSSQPNFKKLVEEVQANMDDENRIPPSIFNQMKALLEAALQDSPEHSVDQTA